MIRSHLPTALACLVLVAVPLSAADLTQLDRKITREPAYRSKPKYCLLVFGRQAQIRIWLVLDGDTLYVDRNGNGDLTEEGEKVVDQTHTGGEEGGYSFEAGEVRADGRTHKQLSVHVSKLRGLAASDEVARKFLARHPGARSYSIGVEMEMPGWQGTAVGGRVPQMAPGVDVNGVLQFADRPQDAPVVHFGGPWQITLHGRQQLTRGRDMDLFLAVGTPGVGPGTTAYLTYSGVIPRNAYPTLEVTYPPGRPGEPPVKERYDLKKRC
jgi:hypothetical protein